MPFHMDHMKNGMKVNVTGMKLDLALSRHFMLSIYTDSKLARAEIIYSSEPR